jgi:hypothetical protein
MVDFESLEPYPFVEKPAAKSSTSDSERVPVRELTTYYPVFWFLLPEGPERDALKREQETPGYKPFKR